MDFQQKQGLSGQSLPLGFTFSFPCRQMGLDQVRKVGSEEAILRGFPLTCFSWSGQEVQRGLSGLGRGPAGGTAGLCLEPSLSFPRCGMLRWKGYGKMAWNTGPWKDMGWRRT